MRRALAAMAAVAAVVLCVAVGVTNGSPAAIAAPVVAADANAVPPVVVVLDISGSMNEDDGAGMIKLTGAKKAVEDVIRRIQPAQPFGLWTYPGGSDSCGSGSWAIPPATISDLNGTIAKADALTADGGTPTGPALRAAAEALTGQGAHRATLVLVSDGESNCGDAPCDVAKELGANGFDVTIHTVGFRVSEAGKAELSCVSTATGGKYVDVDDSDELSDTLRDLTRAQLRLRVVANIHSTAGTRATFTVTVSNTSSIAAGDVRLAMQFADGDSKGVIPEQRLGNIPAGKSVEQTWRAGLALDVPTRPFTVRAWADNAALVSVDGSVGGDSGGALRDQLGDILRKPLDAGHPIVIMGDSYSAGEGTKDYNTPDGIPDSCHRSEKTYLTPSLDPGDVVNLACSGAVSWDFYFTDHNGTPPQLDQLDELARSNVPGAVVLTLGGNDIGFPDIVRQCITPTKWSEDVPGQVVEQGCDKSKAQNDAWDRAADSLRVWLAPVYEDVWKTVNLPERVAARDGAYAPVIVLAYPQVTHATRLGACGALFGPGEVKVANELAARLNAAVKAAVADARTAGYEVYFVSDTSDAMLPDHTVCDGKDAYINGLELAIKPGLAQAESIHPNVAGYAAETMAILDWSVRVTPQGPDTSSTGPKATRHEGRPWYLWTFDIPDIGLARQATVDGQLFAGAPVGIDGEGYAPGTPVIIMIHSTPAVLGTLVADENGEIHGQVPVPPTLELGRHEVVASGTASDGSFREDHLAVAVVAYPPLWVQLALLGAGLLLVAAIVFVALWWFARRRAMRVRA